MRLLDEASAAFLGGDVTDVLALSLVQCELLYACHAVRDYDRAVEWCDHLIAYSERFRLPTVLGYCPDPLRRYPSVARALERGGIAVGRRARYLCRETPFLIV